MTSQSTLLESPMQARQQTVDAIVRQGFLPIYVHDQIDSQMLIEGAIDAGCEVLEYTCRRHDARKMIPWIKRHHPSIKVVGATLVDGQRAAQALARTRPHFTTVDEMADLGVDGMISFLRFQPQTYDKYGQRLVMIPGVGTANEAMDQLELGADLVKVTVNAPPGEALVLHSPPGCHCGFPFLVSGGITANRACFFMERGVPVASAGFDLILKDDLAANRKITSKLVTQRVRAMLDAVRETRRSAQPALEAAIERGETDLIAASSWIS